MCVCVCVPAEVTGTNANPPRNHVERRAQLPALRTSKRVVWGKMLIISELSFLIWKMGTITSISYTRLCGNNNLYFTRLCGLHENAY